MLTNTQLQALKADIAADPAFAGKPLTSGAAYEIAEAYKADSGQKVWRTDAPVSSIIDAINWTSYTPNDAPDNTATYTNRALLAQTKQMNLQLMLQGRQSINASLANLRAGLRDAVIQVPTGAGGAMTAPGGASGATVMTVCTRNANRAENLFAAPSQTTGTVSAKVLTFEGYITSEDVQAARELA